MLGFAPTLDWILAVTYAQGAPHRYVELHGKQNAPHTHSEVKAPDRRVSTSRDEHYGAAD